MRQTAIYVLIFIVVLTLVIKIYDFLNLAKAPITDPGDNIGTNNTGTVITGATNDKKVISLLNEPLDGIKGDILYESSFPKIKINKRVDNLEITFDVTFTDSFKEHYQGYIQSKGYFFAFKFFLGAKDNGGFIDVFRNKSDGVSNTSNGELNGAKLGHEISAGTEWIISGDKVKIAQPAGIYGYTYAYPTQYINSQVGKIIYVGGHLSSVKEMKGRNFTKINNIIIEYEGDEDAIEVVH